MNDFSKTYQEYDDDKLASLHGQIESLTPAAREALLNEMRVRGFTESKIAALRQEQDRYIVYRSGSTKELVRLYADVKSLPDEEQTALRSEIVRRESLRLLLGKMVAQSFLVVAVGVAFFALWVSLHIVGFSVVPEANEIAAEIFTKCVFGAWVFAMLCLRGRILATLIMSVIFYSAITITLLFITLGTKPIDSGLPADQVEALSAARDVGSQMRTTLKEEQGKSALIEKQLKTLYTPSSFSSMEAIQRSLDAVNASRASGMEIGEMLDRMTNMFQDRLNRTSLPDSDKAEITEGYKEAFASSPRVAAIKEMLSTEENWTAATNDLYSYALVHRSHIVVTKDGIEIDSDEVRQQFNAWLAHAERMRDGFLTANEKVSELWNEAGKSEGVNPADSGLNK